MGDVGKGKSAMSYEQAAAELPHINTRLSAAAERYSEAYEEARTALHRCMSIVASEGVKVARLRARATEVRGIVDRGPATPRVIEVDRREDPSLTSGLRAGAEDETDIVTHRDVALNMVELIGGLARIKGVTDEQKLAAAKFRGLWEMAQLGGARAQDYTKVRVDTSGGGEDRTEIIGAAARQEYRDVTQALGMLRSSIVERVLIHDHSLRDLATALDIKWSGSGGKRVKLQLLDAINQMVEIFKVRPGAGGRARSKGWNDGTPTHYSGASNSR